MAGVNLEWARQQIDACDAAIFDNDGTLVDSMPAHYRAWATATRAHGLTFTEEQFYALAGVPASGVLAALNKEQGRDVPLGPVTEAKAAALKDEMSKIEAVAPVMELARYAKARGKRIAVASGSRRTSVIASLGATGIDAYKFFDAVVTAEDVTHGKPHPETFLLAAQLVGVDASRCIGFEDGELGLQSLRSAGMIDVDVRKMPGYPLPDIMKKT